jgi:hypothetical protein
MGVATVTGGGAGGGVCVDCLQPVKTVPTARAIQHACLKRLVVEVLVDFNEM